SVRNYGRMAMDFLAVRVMSDKEILSWARPRHLEHFEAALGDGRGIIMALPHLGSWDIAAAFAQAYGCDLTVITENDWAAQLVAGSRDGHRITLVPRGGSLRPVFRALKARNCVAMLCDAVPRACRLSPPPSSDARPLFLSGRRGWPITLGRQSWWWGASGGRITAMSLNCGLPSAWIAPCRWRRQSWPLPPR